MSTHRPCTLIGVLGTHTEEGKTWVGTRLLAAARQRGLRVAARKPVQSFAAMDDAPTDAQLLAEATGEQLHQVCSPLRCYELAMAPPMAADCLQRSPILLDELLQELTWPADLDLGWLETVGGPRSPLAHDADSVDLLRRVQPDRVLLVADAGLGTLNSILLSLACIPAVPVDVMLNRFDVNERLHQLNRRWLQERSGIEAFVVVEALLESLVTNTCLQVR